MNCTTFMIAHACTCNQLFQETGSCRHFLHAGSAAGGVADLDSMRYNYDGRAIAKAVEKEAEKVGETFSEDKESDSSEQRANELDMQHSVI